MIFNREILKPQDENSIFLDIGCGIHKTDNCIGIDKIETDCTDYVHDVEKMGIPFSSSAVDGIAMFDVIEHLTDWKFVMHEVFRVLKPQGTVEIHFPGEKSRGYTYHIDHKRPWCKQHFEAFDLDNPAHNPEFRHMQKSMGITCNFTLQDYWEDGKDDEKVCGIVLKAIKEYPDNFIPVLSSAGFAMNCGMPNAVRVELGCGFTKRTDPHPFIGIDGYGYEGVDIVKDLERGLPFSDESVDIIFASHFLEHVNNLIGLMDECWRVLKRNGVLELICPWWESVYAHANPSHVRLIHEGLFGYWQSQPTKMDKEAYNVHAQFDIIKNEHSGEGLFTTMIAVKE